jgi:hypothetical protein
MSCSIPKCIRHTLILLLVLPLTPNSSAQLNKRYEKQVGRTTTKKYYEYINKAEMAIIYSHLDSSKNYYDKAFDSVTDIQVLGQGSGTILVSFPI